MNFKYNFSILVLKNMTVASQRMHEAQNRDEKVILTGGILVVKNVPRLWSDWTLFPRKLMANKYLYTI